MNKNTGLSNTSIKILVSRVADWAQARVQKEQQQDQMLYMAATQAYDNHPEFNNNHRAISIPLDAKLLAALAKEGVEVSVRFCRGAVEYTQVTGLIPDNSPTLAKLRKAHNIPAPVSLVNDKKTTVYHPLGRIQPIYCLKPDKQHVLDMLTVIEDAVLAGDGVAVAYELNDMMAAIK